TLEDRRVFAGLGTETDLTPEASASAMNSSGEAVVALITPSRLPERSEGFAAIAIRVTELLSGADNTRLGSVSPFGTAATTVALDLTWERLATGTGRTVETLGSWTGSAACLAITTDAGLTSFLRIWARAGPALAAGRALSAAATTTLGTCGPGFGSFACGSAIRSNRLPNADC
ncbi:MAG: hypothetical protein M1133_15185, partial [Armatimonadetes bacterium]|nr:hypothetical protein [Armatimonadota bacterium]